MSQLNARLLAWYDTARRDLPWRRTRDPYRILLSEALCQQTRVESAIPYYERFLERWPTLESLARAPEDDLLRAWAGLGYYSRARNLHAAARATLERHGGALPRDEPLLRALPGIGPYTSGAVLSIAFGRPVPAIDGNVVRVLSRLFHISTENPRREVERLAPSLVPPDRPGDWNQALMELGALVCTPRSPGCASCPVEGLCRARRSGVEAKVPRPRPRRPSPTVAVAVAVCRSEGRTLLVQRPEKGLLARMWAPPCLEGAPVSTARAARALEASLPVRVLETGPSWTHRFTHRVWRCRAFQCTQLSEIRGARLASAPELDAVPRAFRPGITEERS